MSGREGELRRGVGRRFYVAMAVAACAIVFAGFARTYYLKGLFGTPELPPLRHIHGLVMTAWFVLFAVQTWLVSTRKVAVHRRLGVAGALLAGIAVVVGFMVAIDAARRGATPGPPPLVFLIVPMADMVIFACLVGTALWFRRRPEIHRRLMLLSTLSILPAAIGRIPFLLAAGPLAFFGIPDLIILACVAYDTRKNGRLHPAFLWGGLVVILSHPIRMMVAGTALWMRFATWITG